MQCSQTNYPQNQHATSSSRHYSPLVSSIIIYIVICIVYTHHVLKEVVCEWLSICSFAMVLPLLTRYSISSVLYWNSTYIPRCNGCYCTSLALRIHRVQYRCTLVCMFMRMWTWSYRQLQCVKNTREPSVVSLHCTHTSSQVLYQRTLQWVSSQGVLYHEYFFYMCICTIGQWQCFRHAVYVWSNTKLIVIPQFEIPSNPTNLFTFIFVCFTLLNVGQSPYVFIALRTTYFLQYIHAQGLQIQIRVKYIFALISEILQAFINCQGFCCGPWDCYPCEYNALPFSSRRHTLTACFDATYTSLRLLYGIQQLRPQL